MKSLLSAFICGALSFVSVNCSGPQKPDPATEACKASCAKKMDQCIKRAANNEAKKAACEAVGKKCGRDCTPKK